MQASAVDEQLAQDFLALWLHLVRGFSSQQLGQLEQLGLGLSQLKTLDAIDAAETEPTLGELAARLGLSLPGMSRNIDGLLRRGYVERREDEHDRRMKRLRLTQAGRDALDQINASRLEGLEAFISTLPADQRESLAAALSPVAQGLRP